MAKNVPNPNGKKGGKKHQAKINEIEDDIEKKKLDAARESFFKNKNGKSRFADIVATNKKTGEIEEIHQVGKQNKNGTPIKRERDAIEDIEKLSKMKVIFHPYNIFILIIFFTILGLWM